MAGAAIFSILAPRPSDPAALWDGMSFSNSSMFFGVICGIVNCGVFTLFAVRSLICLRRARDDECDGRFRSSSKGCFTNQWLVKWLNERKLLCCTRGRYFSTVAFFDVVCQTTKFPNLWGSFSFNDGKRQRRHHRLRIWFVK